MPRFDGTGPLGKGPMTGQGEGFCILRESGQNPHHPDGFAGLQGKPIGKVGQVSEKIEDEVNMPLLDATNRGEVRPAKNNVTDLGSISTTPRYIHSVGIGRDRYGPGTFVRFPYKASPQSYGVPYASAYGRWVNPWLRRGFGLHLGGGFGRGRCRGRRRFSF